MPGSIGFFAVDAIGARDLQPEIIDEAGRLKVMPSTFYEDTTLTERALAPLKHGAYCLPTVELNEWPHDYIVNRSAIEIGSRNHVIGDAVGIPAMDNKMQANLAIRAIYDVAKRPPVIYGENVEQCEAKQPAETCSALMKATSWRTATSACSSATRTSILRSRRGTGPYT